jgi:hypothetical protein
VILHAHARVIFYSNAGARTHAHEATGAAMQKIACNRVQDSHRKVTNMVTVNREE